MIWPFVEDCLSVIFGMWLVNLMIDFLFGIDVIGYVKVFIETRLLNKPEAKKEDKE